MVQLSMFHENIKPTKSMSQSFYTPGAVRALPEAVVRPQGPVIAVHHVVVELRVRNSLHRMAEL